MHTQIISTLTVYASKSVKSTFQQISSTCVLLLVTANYYNISNNIAYPHWMFSDEYINLGISVSVLTQTLVVEFYKKQRSSYTTKQLLEHNKTATRTQQNSYLNIPLRNKTAT